MEVILVAYRSPKICVFVTRTQFGWCRHGNPIGREGVLGRRVEGVVVVRSGDAGDVENALFMIIGCLVLCRCTF